MIEYSPQLRHALADSLALIANRPEALTNAPHNWTPHSVVRQLLDDASAERWVALGPQLPVLAEASPDAFLGAIDHLLGRADEVAALYEAESSGGFGASNPMSGILWALEGLAWSSEYLHRVTISLGAFDTLDPGGNWGNRASGSLIHIFLPWFPQTTAKIDERISAVTALAGEFPKAAWKMLLGMLPGATQTSSGTYKPKWINVAIDASPTVSQADYITQLNVYCSKLVSMAASDAGRLVVLSGHLDHLTNDAFEDALKALTETQGVSSGDRYAIWRSLERLVARHKAHLSADWSMSETRISAIEAVADAFKPAQPEQEYLPLFAADNYSLYDDEPNWRQREERLLAAQQAAAAHLMSRSGLRGIVSFANDVDNAFALGWALGTVAGSDLSAKQVRDLGDDDNSKITQLLAGYLAQGHSSGMRPLKEAQFGGLSASRLARLLAGLRLPPAEVWKEAEERLGDQKKLFWTAVDITLVDDPLDVSHAVDEYVSVGRPLAAARVVFFHWFKHKRLLTSEALRALFAAVSTEEEAANIDGHQLGELIGALQASSDVSASELAKLEWAYLDLLTGPNNGAPVTLEQALARDPAFFSECIRSVFRSDKPGQEVEKSSAAQRRIAVSAYRLLSEWSVPPGTRSDGSFDGKNFGIWLEQVVKETSDSGHLVVALHQLGPMLVHVPADPSGLWIDADVAEILNRAEMEELRSGYRTGLFNSRGVHWVDPTGAQELELAATYTDRAAKADARGFVRLAGAMRAMAKEYQAEAESVRSSHGHELD